MQKKSYAYLDAEWGFNASDWIMRARQIFNLHPHTAQFSHLYAYAQRTLIQRKLLLQLGQLIISSALFPGAAITGLQVLPEQTLLDANKVQARVEGIASAPARVSVRQSGTLIYSILVPPGPFVLMDLPLLNATGDLEVSVEEEGRQMRRFRVPSERFRGFDSYERGGFSFAAGSFRKESGVEGRFPWMVSGEGYWRLHPKLSLNLGLFVRAAYLALGARFTLHPFSAFNVSLSTLLSRNFWQPQLGERTELQLDTQLAQGWSASLSAAHQSPGFENPTELGRNFEYNAYRSRLSGSLGWHSVWFGSGRFGYARLTRFKGQTENRATAAWGRQFSKLSLSVNAEWGRGPCCPTKRQEVSISGSLPLGRSPLGEAEVSGRLWRGDFNQDWRSMLLASLTKQVSDVVHYGLSFSGEKPSYNLSYSGQLNLTPHYTRATLNYSHFGHSSAWFAALSGGIMMHPTGVYFSPYNLEDTFGLISVGDLAGVRIQTPSGVVWTDSRGQAVVPALSPFRESALRVETQTLPHNTDLRNGYRSLRAARGSVSLVHFEARRTRRVFLTVKTPSGKLLPKGAVVLDRDGEFVTLTGEDGALFLADASTHPALHLEYPGGTCRLVYQLSENPDITHFFEMASAICRPIRAGSVPVG